MRRAVLYCTYQQCIVSLSYSREGRDRPLVESCLNLWIFSCSFQPAACPDATSNTDTAIDPTNACEYILLYRYYILPDAMWLLPPPPPHPSFFLVFLLLLFFFLFFVFFFFFSAKACPNVEESRTKKNSKRSNRFRRYSRWRSPILPSLWFTSHRRVNANILSGSKSWRELQPATNSWLPWLPSLLHLLTPLFLHSHFYSTRKECGI